MTDLNKVKKVLIKAQAKKIGVLLKEKEWLINTWIQDVSDGDGVLTKETLKEGLLKDMQQALKEG